MRNACLRTGGKLRAKPLMRRTRLALWQQVADAGLPLMLAAERDGGLGPAAGGGLGHAAVWASALVPLPLASRRCWLARRCCRAPGCRCPVAR